MNRRLKKAKKRRMRLAAVVPDGSPTVVTMDSRAHHRRFRFHVPPQAVEKQGLSPTVTSPHSRAVRRRFKSRKHKDRHRLPVTRVRRKRNNVLMEHNPDLAIFAATKKVRPPLMAQNQRKRS